MQAWGHLWVAKEKKKNSLYTSCRSLPMWAHTSLRLFQGRSRQWCTAGTNVKAGPSMWSKVQEGTHCAALQADNGRKLQNRKWCDRPALLHPYYVMKSDLSLHYQWWNVTKCNFELPVLSIVMLYDTSTPLQSRRIYCTFYSTDYSLNKLHLETHKSTIYSKIINMFKLYFDIR